MKICIMKTISKTLAILCLLIFSSHQIFAQWQIDHQDGTFKVVGSNGGGFQGIWSVCGNQLILDHDMIAKDFIYNIDGLTLTISGDNGVSIVYAK